MLFCIVRQNHASSKANVGDFVFKEVQDGRIPKAQPMSDEKKEQSLAEIAKAMVENMKANIADRDLEKKRDQRNCEEAEGVLKNAGLHPDQLKAKENEPSGTKQTPPKQ